MNFGTKIRQRREQLGLSQQDLARLLGMTQSRISEIESGARPHVNLTNLRNLARAQGEVQLEIEGPATLGAVLDALEKRYPVLRGTIRDHDSLKRRPFVRFYACKEDLSHEQPDFNLPEEVAAGTEPFLIIGAMAGG